MIYKSRRCIATGSGAFSAVAGVGSPGADQRQLFSAVLDANRGKAVRNMKIKQP